MCFWTNIVEDMHHVLVQDHSCNERYPGHHGEGNDVVETTREGGEQADTSPTYHIASLLPDYEESIVLLKSFNRDTFFTKCFNHDTIARYVHEVVTPSDPTYKHQVPISALFYRSRRWCRSSTDRSQIPDC